MAKLFKILLFGILGLLALTILLCVMRLASLLADVNWNKTFTIYKEDKSIRALVHGDTDDPFDGWSVVLIWNKEDDKWLVYYLDHKSSPWNEYALKKNGDYIDVYQNGVLLGKLNTSTSEFFHIRQNFMYKKPIAIIHGTNMDDYQKWSYWVDEKGNQL
jgi:hypothetical protein